MTIQDNGMAAHNWSDLILLVIVLLIGAGLVVALIRGTGHLQNRLAGRIAALDLRFHALLSQTRLLEARYDEAIARLGEIGSASVDTRMELGEILGRLADAQRLIEQRAGARDMAREARQERRIEDLEVDVGRALDGLAQAKTADREVLGARQDLVLATLEQTRQQVASLEGRFVLVEAGLSRLPGRESDPPESGSIDLLERFAGIEFRLDALEDAVTTGSPVPGAVVSTGEAGLADSIPERLADPGLTMPLRVISIIER